MITSIIFALGLITVVLSVMVAGKFRKYSKDLDGHSNKLSSAISWQLVGEAVIGFGTLIFATAAHFEWLNDWSIETQSSLRFVMFLATSATTIHLWRTLSKGEGNG
jgi:hypothetical protein